MTFFDLVLQTGGSLHPDGEPDEYISTFTGVIRGEGDDGQVERAGKVLAYRINAGVAAANGEPLSDVCDAHSDELHRIHTLLYEPGQYHYREALLNRFDEAGCDTLVLDYVVLHPRWRGLRLGLLAVRKLIDLVGGGCGLVVSYIAPLRHDAHQRLGVPQSWLPRHRTRDARREATLRLRRYFRQMGFVRVGRTPYYALSMARKAPTLRDLLGPSRQTPP
jgi:hypothetical protein